MARRGRPRKLGPREANGQLRRRRFRDGPTPELKSLREWYAGDGDPALTTYPLGILLANEAISEDQHRAGCQSPPPSRRSRRKSPRVRQAWSAARVAAARAIAPLPVRVKRSSARPILTWAER